MPKFMCVNGCFWYYWEYMPFLLGCKFSDVLQDWLKSVFKVLSISTEMHFSTDLALMSTHPFTLTFIYTLSTLFTFMLHLHFFIYISFHQIGQSHSVLQNHWFMWLVIFLTLQKGDGIANLDYLKVKNDVTHWKTIIPDRSQIHFALNFLLLSSYIASLCCNNLLHTTISGCRGWRRE